MPYKNKQTNPKGFMPKGYEMYNKLIAEMKKKRASNVSSVEIRNDIMESQKRVNYQNEFDRLQGSKKLSALDPNAKNRMKTFKQWRSHRLKAILIVCILRNFNLL